MFYVTKWIISYLTNWVRNVVLIFYYVTWAYNAIDMCVFHTTQFIYIVIWEFKNKTFMTVNKIIIFVMRSSVWNFFQMTPDVGIFLNLQFKLLVYTTNNIIQKL